MVETKKQKQVRVDNWAKFCHQRFQTFFKNSTYCDLTLEFQDNRKLKVHRILMCVCTEYFEEYFDYLKQINQDKKSDVIVMPAALQADVVIPIINFMYTGKLEYKIANFEKLYNASKLMNMSLLTKLLEAQKQTLTPTSEAKKSQSKPGLTPVKKLKLSQSSSTSKSSAQTVSSLSHSTPTKTYPVKTCVNSQLVNKEKVSDSQLPKSTTFSKKATSTNEGHKNLECDAVIDITEDLTSDESSDEIKQILIEHKDIIPTTSFDKFQFQKYRNRMPEIDSIKVEPINVELSNQTTPMLIDENDIIMPNTSFDEPQFPSDMNTMPKVNSIKTEPESSNKSTPIVIDEIDVMPSTSFDKPEFLNDLNILPKKENLEVEDMIDCIKEEAICIEENEFIKNEVSDMEDDFSDEDCFDDFDRDIRLEATPSTSVQCSGRICSYFNCERSKRKCPSLRIFHFPVKDEDRCNKWIENAGNPDLLSMDAKKLKQSYICDDHFDDYLKLGKYLPKQAVPKHFSEVNGQLLVLKMSPIEKVYPSTSKCASKLKK